MIVNRTEQHIIKKGHIGFELVDTICYQSKNIYNYTNYILRQEFITNGNYIKRFDMQKIVKDADCYKELGSNTGQVTIQMVDLAWKSFFTAIKDWKNNPSKYKGIPKIPKYLKKDGRYVVGITNNKYDITDGYIRFGWKKLKSLNGLFKTRIPSNARLMLLRFIPKGLYYSMEICYQIEVPDCDENMNRIVSIDVGTENFITMVNNIGVKPIVIKGGFLKSINQYYNKKKSLIQSELKTVNKLNWSKRLQRLTDKRNKKLKYEMHCISKYIIDWCVLYGVDTLVVGHNNNWKQQKQGMQNFIYIPYDIFIQQLQYKCENNGIKCIVVEESYTSGTSFLDNESPCKSNYDKSRRVQRGLFVSNNGRKINADVNAAYQIMKKVVPNIFEGIEDVYCHPMIIKKLVA